MKSIYLLLAAAAISVFTDIPAHAAIDKQRPLNAPAPAVVAPVSPRPQKMVVVGEIKAGTTDELDASLKRKILTNLRKSLVSNLAKTRKFAVLDREFGDELKAEKHPEDTDRSEAGRTARLGQEATAEFLLTGSVKTCETRTSKRTIKSTGKDIADYSYLFQVEIRLVDVVSSRVLFADSISVSKKGSSMSVPPAADSWLISSCDEVGAKGVSKILEYIYPLQVIALAEDGTVIINEGEGRVALKQHFEVYSLGKKLIDPYTNVELGNEESLEGKIEITRVLPKLSYGKIETISAKKITPGCILRQITDIAESPSIKKPDDSILKQGDL